MDVSCSGFMEAGSMRSLGRLPMANSTSVSPLRVTCVFLTVAALRINWARVICARVVWSKIFKAISTRAERHFLIDLAKQCTVLLEVSLECAFDRKPACHEDCGMPVCTNRFRIHLESVHPLVKFGNDFRWRCTLTLTNCEM